MKTQPFSGAKCCVRVLCYAVAMSGLVSQLPAEEHLKDCGFESQPHDWGAGYKNDYKPALQYDSPFKVTLDQSDPHSGDTAMRVDLGANLEEEVIIHSFGIPVPEGSRTLQVSFFTKSVGLLEGSASVGVLERDEKAPTGFLSQKEKLEILPASINWKKVELSGELAPGTRLVIIMFRFAPQSAASQVWIDDLSVDTQ